MDIDSRAMIVKGSVEMRERLCLYLIKSWHTNYIGKMTESAIT